MRGQCFVLAREKKGSQNVDRNTSCGSQLSYFWLEKVIFRLSESVKLSYIIPWSYLPLMQVVLTNKLYNSGTEGVKQITVHQNSQLSIMRLEPSSCLSGLLVTASVPEFLC